MLRDLIHGILLFCLFIFCIPAWSQQNNLPGGSPTAGTSTTSGLQPTQASLSAKTFQYANTPFSTAQFLGCEMFGAGGLSGIASQAVDGFKSIMNGSGDFGKCEGALPSKISPDCKDYVNEENLTFNETKLDAAIKKMHDGATSGSCQVGKIDTALNVMDCFSNMLTKLKEEMETVKQDFDRNLQVMKRYVSDVRTEMHQQEQRRDTLTGKISSLESTLSRVNGVLARVNGASSGEGRSVGNITDLKLRLQNYETDIKNFETYKRTLQGNRTAQCLLSGGSQQSQLRRCTTLAGDLVEPKDCLIRLYQEEIEVKLAGGVVPGMNTAEAKKAEREARIFEQRLRQIVSQMTGNNPRFQVVPGLLETYGDELRSFGYVGNLMIKELKTCEKDVTEEMKRELKNTNSQELGGRALALKNEGEVISSQSGEMIRQLDTTIRDVGREIYGQELNELVNGNGCNTATVVNNNGTVSFSMIGLRSQLQCVQGLNANIEALVNGTTPPGASGPVLVPLNVPGLDNSPARCKGLRDCLVQASNLKATSEQRIKDLGGDGTFRDSRCANGQCPGLRKFAKEANESIKQAFGIAAGAFKNRVALLTSQFSRLKELFGKANLKGLTDQKSKVRQFKCEAKDEDGLCQMPDSFGDTIAELAGVPKLEPENFDIAKQEASQKKAEIAAKKTELEEAATALEDLKNNKTCKVALAKKKGTKKLTKLGRRLRLKLSKCKTEAGKESVTTADLNSFIDKNITNLSKSLDDVCEYLDDDECGTFEEELEIAGENCSQVFAQARKQFDDDKLRREILEQHAHTARNLGSGQPSERQGGDPILDATTVGGRAAAERGTGSDSVIRSLPRPQSPSPTPQ